jgi:hypothetical protein
VAPLKFGAYAQRYEHDEKRFFASPGQLPAREWAHRVGIPLTDGERQVLSLVEQGHTNREVALILGFSCKTGAGAPCSHVEHARTVHPLTASSPRLARGYLTPEPL